MTNGPFQIENVVRASFNAINNCDSQLDKHYYPDIETDVIKQKLRNQKDGATKAAEIAYQARPFGYVYLDKEYFEAISEFL